MTKLKAILLTLFVLLDGISPQCAGIAKLQSPANLFNNLFDSLFNTFDISNKTEDLVLTSILQNASQTKFKVLFKIMNTQTNSPKYFIGVQTELVTVNDVQSHRIIQYVQSEISNDVSAVMRQIFEDKPQIKCSNLKNDFIDYFGTTPKVIEWFTKYYKIDTGDKTAQAAAEASAASIQQLTKSNEDLKLQVASLTAQSLKVDALQQEKAQLQQANDKLVNDLKASDASKVDLAGRLQKLQQDDALNKLKTQLDEQMKAKADFEARVVQLGQANQALKDDQVKTKTDLEAKLKQLEQINQGLRDAQLNQVTPIPVAAVDSNPILNNQRKEIDSLRAQLAASLNDLENARKQANNGNAQIQELEAVKKQLNDRNSLLDQLKKKVDADTAALKDSNATALVQLQQEKDAYSFMLKASYEKQLQDTQNALKIAQSSTSELQTKNLAMKDELNQKNIDLSILSQQKEQASQNIQKQQLDLITKYNELKKANDTRMAMLQKQVEGLSSQAQPQRQNQQNQQKPDIQIIVPNNATTNNNTPVNQNVSQAQGNQIDLQLNLVADMQNKFMQIVMSLRGSGNNVSLTMQQQSLVANNFIRILSPAQTKLIDDYLVALATILNSQPVAVTSIPYDKIPLILDQVKLQLEKKKSKTETKNDKALIDNSDKSKPQNLQPIANNKNVVNQQNQGKADMPIPIAQPNANGPRSPFAFIPTNNSNVAVQNSNPFVISNINLASNFNRDANYNQNQTVRPPTYLIGRTPVATDDNAKVGEIKKNPFLLNN